jgi:ATP-dependent protease HslVU (ClpYQ) ATPase subunit
LNLKNILVIAVISIAATAIAWRIAALYNIVFNGGTPPSGAVAGA